MVLTMAVCAWGRVWFARRLVGMSARHWFFRILLPLAALGAAGVGAGLLPRLWLHEGTLLRVALTTNTLPYALLAPNLGVEVFVSPRLSLALDGVYGWWGYPDGNTIIENWSIGGEARYWLHPDGRYLGHHLGLGIRSGQYDVAWNDPGRRGQFTLAGINYGHTWVLRRRWTVDAGLGLGYVRAKYDKYQWHPDTRCYERLAAGRVKNTFGLTDLHVSISYRF